MIMGRGRGKGEGGAKETDPAIPKPEPKGDQITNVIGEVGRWQLEKILIVFIAAAPGDYLISSFCHCTLFL